jgi:UDP-N-acetyl-D-mannosaminuronic acid dehydrogenase
MNRKFDICVIGGAGHVGLPLGIYFASKGQRVALYDVNEDALRTVRSGVMPFIEFGAEDLLKSTITRTLFPTSDRTAISQAAAVIVAVGTPVDEYLNPRLRALLELFADLAPHLDEQQTIVVRSTVYPGTCKQVLETLKRVRNADWRVAYCPERIAQGYAIRELKDLPQLVSGLDPQAEETAAKLFSLVAPSVIRVSVEEAELAKLFSNAWRYIQFAAANQFYVMANEFGVDFERVRVAMVEGYGRAAGLPSAGFAAGPCLLKDTMQLAAFNNHNFMLGQAAMNINEGLPNYIVESLRRKHDISKKCIGILGMAFKADIDDTRDALSFKLGKVLRFHGARVLYSDEFARDPTFIPKEKLVDQADIVVVGVPHSAYRKLAVPAGKEVVDVWNCLPARAH